ncbi:MAG: addiction module protein [Planctomycetota bacterium]
MITDTQKHALLRLSIEQRIELVEFLSESLADVDDPVPESHKRLLEQRMAEHLAEPAAGDDLDVVLARLEAADR